MSTEPINYEAVLADLEARKAQLETAIAAIRQIMGQAQPDGGSSPLGDIINIKGDWALAEWVLGIRVPGTEPYKKNPAAVALGRLGGKKGGKKRAEALSAEQRSKIASHAARARWEKEKVEPSN